MKIASTRLIVVICCVLALLLAIISCGGSGGGSGGRSGGSGSTGTTGTVTTTSGGTGITPSIATGKVILPAGFKDQITILKVSSSLDTEPVAANGTFKILVTGGGENEVDLLDPSGNVVLMGYADASASGSAEAGGKGEISAAKTAVAMLFNATSGYTLDPSLWSSFNVELAQDSPTTILAGVIASRVAANPTAIANNDSQIVAAMKTAESAITAGHIPSTPSALPFRLAPSVATRVSVTRTTAGATSTDLLIQPSGEQAGLEVIQNPTGSGLVIVNHFRRRVAAYIYRIATQQFGGVLTDLPTIEPMPSPFAATTTMNQVATAAKLNIDSADAIEIQASNPLHGTVGSIVDLLFGNGAFTPTTSNEIDLPLASGTIRTDYEIVLIGPSWASGNDLSSLSASLGSQYSSYVPFWQAAIQDIDVEEFTLDFFLPLVSSVNFDGETEFNGVEVGEALDLIGAISSLPDFYTAVRTGQWSTVINTLFQSGADIGSVRDKLFMAFWNSNFMAPVRATSTFANADKKFERFFELLAIVDAALQSLDSITLVKDSSFNYPGVFWTGTVVEKKATLSPSSATIDDTHQSVVLVTSPGNASDISAQYVYDYSATGPALGSIEDATHNSGTDTSFESIDNQITFLPNLKAAVESTATVTVAVFLNTGTAKAPVKGAEVGSATSTITIAQTEIGACGVLPASHQNACSTISVSPTNAHLGDTVTVNVHYSGTVGCGGVGQPVSVYLINYGFEPQSITLDGSAATAAGKSFTQVNLGIVPKGASLSHTITYVLGTNPLSEVCPSVNKSGQLFGVWADLDIPEQSAWTPLAVTAK